MTYEQLIAEVEHRAGGADRQTAETAVVATVAALGERVPAIAIDSLAEALPAPLAEILRAGSHRGDFDADELFERVAAREGVGAGAAREHAQIVCAAVTDTLTLEARRMLRTHLPGSVAALFEPQRRATPAPPHTRAHEGERRRPLSSAQPGSTRPLNEAGPEATAHTGSIAASENPHADTKLSTGARSGERTGESLSSGRPGSTRPLSEGEE